MSLQHHAQNLAAHGRNGDSMLVHMTPNEVAGLQSLALAHGGSLTINPHTGLPEASFLGGIIGGVKNAVADVTSSGIGSLLVGGAMAAMGVPPQFIPYIVGGASTWATGNLGKGVMAGLGAYGGSSLYSGLSGLGAESMAPTVDQSAAETARLSQAEATATGATSPASTQAVINATPEYEATPLPGTENASKLGTLQAGVEKAATDPGALYDKMGWKGAAAVAAPLALSTAPKTTMPDGSEVPTNQAAPGYIRQYYYNPATHGTGALTPVATKDWNSKTFEQGTPYIPLKTAATGGIVALADGGLPIDADQYAAPVKPQVTVGPNLPVSNEQLANMQALRSAYTAGGGNLPSGPILAPTASYTAAPQSQAAYDYLSGKAAYPVQQTGIGQNTRYYWGNPPAAQTGASQYESKMWLNPSTNKLESNPYYAMDKTITPTADPGAGMKWSWDTTQLRYVPVKKADGGLLALAQGGMSQYNLGSYSDGGRLLKGPGDGVSDSIPATIGDKQPARLADGEFVVPARIVSELGNGSTDAGARKLYQMMDRVQNARKQTTGKNRVAKNTNAETHLPA